MLSLVILVLRLINNIGNAIVLGVNNKPFNPKIWTIIGTFLFYHFLLIVVNKIWKKFSYFHGPLLILSFLASCYMASIQPKVVQVNVSLSISYCLFLFSGLLLNVSWILSTIAVIINFLAIVLFFVYFYKISDFGTISQITILTIFVVISLYYWERMTKTSFIELKKNEKLNFDLKNLLLNFPKPILLLDEKNKEVILANKELYRLLSLDENQDLKAVSTRLNEKILEPYNYIEGLGENNFNQNQDYQEISHSSLLNIIQEEDDLKLNLYETINQEQTEQSSQLYMIKTTHDFEDDLPQNYHYKNNSPRDNNQNILQDTLIQNRESQNRLLVTEQQDLNENRNSQHSGNQQGNHEQYKEVVNLKVQEMHFQNKDLKMILLHRITSFVKYEKLKMENNFYEMITATVSHDMRTPINSITGLIDNLEYFIKDNEGKKLLQVIRNSSKILLFLVNDILDFFQLKNGKFKSSLQETDVKESVNAIIDMFEIVANEKKIELNSEFDKNIPDLLLTDDQRLKQVLINLITNSLKFTIQGQITILASYDEKDHMLNFHVRDTGVGVVKEDQAKLFKLFGKAENNQELNTKGIGLGLNICKKVVEACGGKIFLESEYEKGASFCFGIKAYTDQKQISRKEYQLAFDSEIRSRKQSQQSQLQSAKTKSNSFPQFRSFLASLDSSLEKANIDLYTKDALTSRSLLPQLKESQIINTQIACPCSERPQILIVDDNIFNILTLQTILEMQFNQRVDKATNGLEGIEKIKERQQEDYEKPCFCDQQNQNYKIVFMDCNMPIMDGFESTVQIRKFQNIDQKALKIIAQTANTNNSFKKKCLECGMDEFLTKPLSADKLRHVLIKRGLLNN
eukprot:403353540